MTFVTDLEGLEVAPGTYTGQKQELGGADSTRGYDDLLTGLHCRIFVILVVQHSNCSLLVEKNLQEEVAVHYNGSPR